MLQIDSLIEIIQDKSNAASYGGLDSTRIHRLSVYEAYDQLLQECPQELVNYLLDSKRGYNIQSRLFQKYVSILENKIPFDFVKYKQRHFVRSLLDDNLNIFDGLSVFSSTVDSKGLIKNGTTELYMSGKRGATYQPFFLGKILEIVDVQNHTSIVSNIESYSFSEIKMKNTQPGTNVLVSHLRIVPHYQMGAMVYINRIRKEIIQSI